MNRGVVTMARLEDWRPGVMEPFGREPPFFLLEVAYDRKTAEQAWRENVPADLPRRSGEAQHPGIYASLDEVNLDTHVVAVWSSGQSGGCAAWVHDIVMNGQRPTVRETQSPTPGCTDEFNDYALVLAVPRSRLPKKSRLPMDDAFRHNMTLDPSVAQSPDAVIDVYPATGWPPGHID